MLLGGWQGPGDRFAPVATYYYSRMKAPKGKKKEFVCKDGGACLELGGSGGL